MERKEKEGGTRREGKVGEKSKRNKWGREEEYREGKERRKRGGGERRNGGRKRGREGKHLLSQGRQLDLRSSSLKASEQNSTFLRGRGVLKN